MKRSTLVATVFALLFGSSLTATADEKVDKVAKDLDGRFAKIDSYTAKTESMIDSQFGPNHAQKSKIVGTMAWVRKGAKILMRNEMKDQTVKTEDGKTTETTSDILMVSDGEFLYSLSEVEGKKFVTKSFAPSAKDSSPSAMFNQLKAYYDIKLLPDETVDGDDCYVFEMKMKPMEGVPPSGRQVSYYQKKTGISIKNEGFDADGKLTHSSIMKDLKINANVSDDSFKFEIPEGAQVSDMTKQQQQQQPPDEQVEPKEEPQAEQPKEEKEEPKKPEKKKKKKKLFDVPKLP